MTINLEDLADLYTLFSEGIVIGALLAGVPFIVGYAIQGIINVMSRS